MNPDNTVELIPTTPTTYTQELVSTVPVPPDLHPVAVYLARLAPGSRRTILLSLDTIAQLVTAGRYCAHNLVWPSLRYQHTAAIRSELTVRYRPATVNKMLAALRGVLKECWRLGYMSADDFRRATDLPHVTSDTLPRGRALGIGEISSLISSCAADSGSAGIRDAALIAALYGAGLRRSEIIKLTLADYNTDTGELRVLASKGRKDRLTYLRGGASQALHDWISIRGTEPGPLFCHVDKGGRIVLRYLSDQSVRTVLLKRGQQAGVLKFAPHDMRRSFITNLLDNGADTFVVQQLAGHSDPKTTKRYDRRGEAAKRSAAGLLHVPYFRRKD